jgi:hypothetical protein
MGIEHRDRNYRVVATSSLIHVTVVPAFTVMRCGANAKLSIFTSTAAVCAADRKERHQIQHPSHKR